MLIKEAVKAHLDKYEAEGYITSASDPTDWISNMVTVRRSEKLRIWLQLYYLSCALKLSHHIMPTLVNVLYKLPNAKVSTLVYVRDAFLQCKLDEASSLITIFLIPCGWKRWFKSKGLNWFKCVSGLRSLPVEAAWAVGRPWSKAYRRWHSY